MKATYGLLVDYGYCTGCSACETACLNARPRGASAAGVRVMKLGPLKAPSGSWQFDFVPVLTDWCDLCGLVGQPDARPACCIACCYGALTFGNIETLGELMAIKPKMMIITPPAKTDQAMPNR